ncbi:unnamed protein product [Cylindrotheca closterium]|uniref:Uncharacterized protein n=1 Tax=Cylindrotheca closterium TaxID=2856 RepID=A0AAD2CHG7_9STRA|nr:unnamed protein product [Cylindrotheca closterium]
MLNLVRLDLEVPMLTNLLNFETDFFQSFIDIVKWIDKIISMKYKTHFQNHTNWTIALDRGYLDILDDNDMADNDFILDAKYEATTGVEVASKQVHLTKTQQDQLATALENTQELFDGNLGHYKHYG